MYKTHKGLAEPDISLVIWHYFTLPKFLSLLHTKSLFLCRHDQFGDGYEGRLSVKDEQFFETISPGILHGMKHDQWGCSFSSCWTQSPVDEYVLWSSYSSLKEGVAVRSTIARLISSLSPEDPHELYLSEVNYIDYNEEYTFKKTKGLANMIAPHFTKRKYFAAEKEIRLMHFDPNARFNKSAVGILAPVDLDILMESVYVSPMAQPWFQESIEGLLQLFGLGQIEVKKSEI